MKRLVIVVVALLLVCLNAIPVAAQIEDEVFIKVKGEVSFDWEEDGIVDAVAKVKNTYDSASGKVIGTFKFGKSVYCPWANQWITGIYGEGELVSWEIVGSEIILDPGPTPIYVLPSGDYLGTEQNNSNEIGIISGNKITIDLGEPFTLLTGTIKIK